MSSTISQVALGVPELRRGRLEPDVVAAAVGHLAGQLGHRLHREGGRRHVGELVRDRLVLAHRPPPLHALGGQAAADLETQLGAADRARRDRQPAGVERGERDLEPLALLADQVLDRHAHVGEREHARWRGPAGP